MLRKVVREGRLLCVRPEFERAFLRLRETSPDRKTGSKRTRVQTAAATTGGFMPLRCSAM